MDNGYDEMEIIQSLDGGEARRTAHPQALPGRTTSATAAISLGD